MQPLQMRLNVSGIDGETLEFISPDNEKPVVKCVSSSDATDSIILNITELDTAVAIRFKRRR